MRWQIVHIGGATEKEFEMKLVYFLCDLPLATDFKVLRAQYNYAVLLVDRTDK